MQKYKKKGVGSKKYVTGTQKVAVPPVVTQGEIAGNTLNGALAGAQAGMSLGPMGAAAGAIIGGGASMVNGMQQRTMSNMANKEAGKLNDYFEYQNATAQDPKLQSFQYKTGSKQIEIEGKRSPEIHTDKNYTVKNLGSKPHTEGGNKVIAQEGDIVFPTQNDPSKYKKILSDISKYKLSGDKKAFGRLEKYRKSLPSDNSNKKPTGDKEVTVGNSAGNFNTLWNTVTPQQDYFTNENLGLGTVPEVQAPENYNFFDTGTIPGTDMSSTTPPKTPNFNNLNKVVGDASRFSNLGYNLIKSQDSLTSTFDRQLSLSKYKYSDMSEPTRNVARQAYRTQVSNADRSGMTVAQKQSYANQANNNLIDNMGQINQREIERKQNILNSNNDLSNTETQVNFENARQNSDINARRAAARQSFAGASAAEITNLSETKSIENQLKQREQNIVGRDTQYLGALKTPNYGWNTNAVNPNNPLDMQYNRTFVPYQTDNFYNQFMVPNNIPDKNRQTEVQEKGNKYIKVKKSKYKTKK